LFLVLLVGFGVLSRHRINREISSTMRLISPLLLLLCETRSLVAGLSTRNVNQQRVCGEMSRRSWSRNVARLSFLLGSGMLRPASSFGLETPTVNSPTQSKVAYKSLSLPMEEFGVSIPVACWFPSDGTSTASNSATYRHRISVKRIGQLLAGWDFIPEFASRDFQFPASSRGASLLLDGDSLEFPAAPKVVFLAHGYLGSRFDLSHIAEELAQQGFTCISAEYPESLAASYPRMEGLDRSAINDELLKLVKDTIQPKSYAVIGHSLGCGTALRMGDDSWTRVLIAGRPPEAPSSPMLFISSTNDCTVRFGGPLMIPRGYEMLQETNLPSEIPKQSALIFDRLDAPNHISYLSENVNEAMIDLLSPLLPVANAMSIPVLDFDKYKESRDSLQTAEILKPVISRFLLQSSERQQ
jgi:hypothetical protein